MPDVNVHPVFVDVTIVNPASTSRTRNGLPGVDDACAAAELRKQDRYRHTVEYQQHRLRVLAMDLTGRVGPDGYALLSSWFPDQPHRARLNMAQPSDVFQGKLASYVCKRNAKLIHHAINVLYSVDVQAA
jgi:hypothetical protein